MGTPILPPTSKRVKTAEMVEVQEINDATLTTYRRGEKRPSEKVIPTGAVSSFGASYRESLQNFLEKRMPNFPLNKVFASEGKFTTLLIAQFLLNLVDILFLSYHASS